MNSYIFIGSYLNEESANRLYSLITKGSLVSWGILSPFKGRDYWIDKLIKDNGLSKKLNRLCDKETPESVKNQIIWEFNAKRMRKLKSILSDFKWGYNSVWGMGQEEVFERDSEGKVLFNSDGTEKKIVKPSREIAFFINDISLKEIEELSDSFDQTGFIYFGPETDRKIKLYVRYGNQKEYKVESTYTKVQVDVLSDFFTSINKHKLVFTEKVN